MLNSGLGIADSTHPTTCVRTLLASVSGATGIGATCQRRRSTLLRTRIAIAESQNLVGNASGGGGGIGFGFGFGCSRNCLSRTHAAGCSRSCSRSCCRSCSWTCGCTGGGGSLLRVWFGYSSSAKKQRTC